ncbi:hypothetical protein [Lawsonibacter sp. JLR.KK007]|uniref:hypothetical protein n=1 Tax=Lawsonibacter sp. JLR.KK007 TaxID=3114293 RepID=UPI002FF2C69C
MKKKKLKLAKRHKETHSAQEAQTGVTSASGWRLYAGAKDYNNRERNTVFCHGQESNQNYRAFSRRWETDRGTNNGFNYT